MVIKIEYGLIAEKLSHSFSKEIHARLADYSYELKEIASDELDSFMTKKEFKAINVTIPYKSRVIPYLDFIDSAAEKIGAVNTVVNKNGKLYGFNTDYLGMKALIFKNGIEIKDKKVLIAVLVSFAASFVAGILPVVSQISEGTRTIILTVAISALAALLFPRKTESGGEK